MNIRRTPTPCANAKEAVGCLVVGDGGRREECSFVASGWGSKRPTAYWK